MNAKVLRLNISERKTLSDAAAELDTVALDHRLCNATGPAHAPKFDHETEREYYETLRRLSAELKAILERAQS